jgi:hypothetical protein
MIERLFLPANRDSIRGQRTRWSKMTVELNAQTTASIIGTGSEKAVFVKIIIKIENYMKNVLTSLKMAGIMVTHSENRFRPTHKSSADMAIPHSGKAPQQRVQVSVSISFSLGTCA